MVVSKETNKIPFPQSPTSSVQYLMSVFAYFKENPFFDVFSSSALPNFGSSALLDFCSSELLHLRYYGSTIGRFMKPDNVSGSPLNPQNWNLYSYVRGNPVNMNDPTGHSALAALSLLMSSAGYPNSNAPGDPQTGGDEARQQHESKDKAKVDPKQTVDALISSGQIGSFKNSLDVQSALKNNQYFREGFEAWLTTESGSKQFEQMSNDKNTQYIIEIGAVTGGERAETVPSWFNQNDNTGGRIDYQKIRIILNNFWRSSKDSYMLADALGHEGFHAEDYGSGKYTSIGASHHKQLLDSDNEYTYWKMAKYKDELDALSWKGE